MNEVLAELERAGALRRLLIALGNGLALPQAAGATITQAC
jgi:hypothetical protein